MGSHIVRPDSKKLTLSTGEFIVVKKHLSYGEKQAMFQRRYQKDDLGRFQVNQLRSQTAKITAYLVDWNLLDLDGMPLTIRGASEDDIENALGSFYPYIVDEIENVIDEHVRAMTLELDAQKKTTLTGASASSPPSTSPDVVAGATSGSTS